MCALPYSPFFATVEASPALGRHRAFRLVVTMRVFSMENAALASEDLPFLTTVEAAPFLGRLRAVACEMVVASTALLNY